MALTKIGTGGIQDDAVTSGKIPANAVGSSELASSAVTNVKIAAGNVDNTAIGNNQVSLNKLVQGTSSTDGKFLRANNGADPSFETVSIPAGTTINNNADNRVITGSGTANTLNGESNVQIDSSGRLLIGTTTEGNDDADEITISGTRTGMTIRSANDDYGNIFFSDATSGTGEYVGALQYYHADNSLRLKTSSADRLLIDSSGRVGIGTNNPTDKFHVVGTTNLAGNSYLTNAYVSGSIFLGGTGSNNQLEDYEEGTWTPKLKKYANGGWQNASMNSNGTVQKARYVKIGSVVTCHLHWDGWQNGDANYATMGDLPFTCSSTSGGFGTVSYTDAFTNNQNQGIYINGDSTTISFYYNSNGWNGWNSSSNRNIHLGFTYITDA